VSEATRTGGRPQGTTPRVASDVAAAPADGKPAPWRESPDPHILRPATNRNRLGRTFTRAVNARVAHAPILARRARVNRPGAGFPRGRIELVKRRRRRVRHPSEHRLRIHKVPGIAARVANPQVRGACGFASGGSTPPVVARASLPAATAGNPTTDLSKTSQDDPWFSPGSSCASGARGTVRSASSHSWRTSVTSDPAPKARRAQSGTHPPRTRRRRHGLRRPPPDPASGGGGAARGGAASWSCPAPSGAPDGTPCPAPCAWAGSSLWLIICGGGSGAILGSLGEKPSPSGDGWPRPSPARPRRISDPCPPPADRAPSARGRGVAGCGSSTHPAPVLPVGTAA
jgi:hypothetical protein